MSRVLVLVGATALLSSGVAFAASSQTLELSSLGVSMTFPDGWETKSEDDNVTGRKDMTGVMLRQSDKGTVDEAVKDMRDNLGRILPNGKLDKKSKAVVGELKGVTFRVTGGENNLTVRGTMTVLQVSKGKVAVVLAMGPAPEFDANAKEVKAIVASLKKTKRK